MGLFDTETNEEKKKKKNAVHRLTDMIVTDVDIVDRPANGRRFLMFKRGCGMADESSVEIAETQEGEVIAVQVSEPDVESETAPEASESEDKKETQEDSVEEDKKTDEVKEVSKQEPMEESAEKARGEGQGQDGPRQGDGGTSTCVCPKCGREMEHERGEPCTEKKCPDCDEPMVGKEEKAEEKLHLSSAMKNSVLGSIQEATDRLMSVQTVLRSANTTTEKASAPLPNKIYNELKGIGTLISGITGASATPQAKGETGASESVRDILKQAGVVMHGETRDTVMEAIGSNVEKLLALANTVKGIEESEEKSEGEIPKVISEALKAVTDSISEVVDKFPSPAAKCDEVLAKLQEHFDGIKGVVSEVLSSAAMIPEEKAEGMDEEEEDKDKDKEMEKSADAPDDILTGVKKSIDELILTLNGKKVETKKELPASNAADADGTEPVKKAAKSVQWPEDISESIKEREGN